MEQGRFSSEAHHEGPVASGSITMNHYRITRKPSMDGHHAVAICGTLWHPRVKFEDEKPVQQAARMLGLQIEASF